MINICSVVAKLVEDLFRAVVRWADEGYSEGDPD